MRLPFETDIHALWHKVGKPVTMLMSGNFVPATASKAEKSCLLHAVGAEQIHSQQSAPMRRPYVRSTWTADRNHTCFDQAAKDVQLEAQAWGPLAPKQGSRTAELGKRTVAWC